MKIIHKKGSKLVRQILTAKKWQNKIDSITDFSSKTSIIDTRIKGKPKDVMIVFKFGRSKGKEYYNYSDSQQKENYYYSNVLWSMITDGEKLTKKNLLKKVREHLEIKWNLVQADLGDDYEPHPLREICYKFLY